MGAGLNLTCSFWFMALTQEGSYPVFFFFLRTERITEACDAAGAVTSHFLPHEHSTVFPQMESSSSYFAPHCGQTMFIALSPCELPDGDLSCLKYHNLFQVQGEEQSFLLFDGIGRAGAHSATLSNSCPPRARSMRDSVSVQRRQAAANSHNRPH